MANDAHELTGITYRQLDHWAGQGWVCPPLDQGCGRAGRRLYSAADVVRFDLRRHLAMSKVNTAEAGPRVADVEVPDGDTLVVVVPGGRKDGDVHLRIVDRAAAIDFLADGGAWVVSIRSRSVLAWPGCCSRRRPHPPQWFRRRR